VAELPEVGSAEERYAEPRVTPGCVLVERAAVPWELGELHVPDREVALPCEMPGLERGADRVTPGDRYTVPGLTREPGLDGAMRGEGDVRGAE
jgi:hypothetical protein